MKIILILILIVAIDVLQCEGQIFHRRVNRKSRRRDEGVGVINRIATRPEGFLNRPLYLGDTSGNYTRADCMWKRDQLEDCPDQDVSIYFYSSESPKTRKKVNEAEADWLRFSGWNPLHKNVLLIHGYAGGDGKLPTVILRDAYLKNGSYNVFVLHWEEIARPPCYPAAVHNLKLVAKCAAQTFTFLRTSGLPEGMSTCVGHSLGAHLCGLISQALQFRMHRIIALDPAKPLIRSQNKLTNGDADVVQVMHTNAGHYGEAGRLGSVDFCVNGGRMQPFCVNKTNAALCSHMRSVCYLAESINTETSRLSSSCTRRCPTGNKTQRPSTTQPGGPVLMGEHTPNSAVGTYCVTNYDEPYCPQTPDDVGDLRCCSDPGEAAAGFPSS